MPHPSSTEPQVARIRVVVRATLLGFGLLALGGVAYLVAVTPPTPDSFYPKCAFYQITKLHCPGCGTGRAAHAVLNGRFLDSLRNNVYAVLVVPVLFVVAIRRATWWVVDRQPPRRKLLHANWIRLVLIGILLFWLLRNINVYPFTLLAPSELG